MKRTVHQFSISRNHSIFLDLFFEFKLKGNAKKRKYKHVKLITFSSFSPSLPSFLLSQLFYTNCFLRGFFAFFLLCHFFGFWTIWVLIATVSLPLFALTFFPFSATPAKPKNSAKAVTVQAGSKSVMVAHCEAADGKPAATIKWLASVGGNHSTTSTNGPDGTVTVRSEYRLVPTAEDNGREVTCLVDQKTQDRPWTEVLKLSVECKLRKTNTHVVTCWVFTEAENTHRSVLDLTRSLNQSYVGWK